MVSITLSVPQEIRKIMRDFPEVNWSALVRKEIIKKADELKMKESLVRKLDSESDFNDWATTTVRKGRNK